MTPGAAASSAATRTRAPSRSNESTVEPGLTTSANGGNANATGGNGGNADTGNTQEGNSNAAAFADSPEHSGPPVKSVDGWKPPFGGGKSEAEAKGGNTSACSGNARGGNGGNANAQGGNANASNDAQVHQQNSSVSSGEHPCWDGCKPEQPRPRGSPATAASPAAPGATTTTQGSKQENESTIHQGDNDATGGNATATGGNGGNADTGNTQSYNGNALAGLLPRKEVLV